MVASPQKISMMVIFQSEANEEAMLRSTVATGKSHQKRTIQLMKEDLVIASHVAGLFQLHPVLEGFANALGDKIVTVCVGVESDGLQGVDIHFALLHLVGLHGGLQHLADDA